MRLTRFSSAMVGLLTALPLMYVVLYTTYIIPRLATFGSPGGIERAAYFKLFHLSFALHMAVIVLSAALLAFYMLLIHRARIVPAERRSRWTAFLLLGTIVSMPVFWYLYVWPGSSGLSPQQERRTLGVGS